MPSPLCSTCRHKGGPVCRVCPHASGAPGGDVSPTRQRAGSKAQAGGRSWESTLEQLLAVMERRGLCTWWRTPEALKRTRNDAARPHLWGGECVCIPLAKGPPDYVIFSRGKAIAVEAKRTCDSRWPFSQLAEHQAQALDQVQLHGSVGVVALDLQGEAWALPWRTLGPRWWAWRRNLGRATAGTASVGRGDLPELGAVKLDGAGEWVGVLGG